MSGSLLPNGEQQFISSNGAPLAGGSVYFYVPGTTTPKQTWQNPSLTVLNSNPVVLDSAGRAIIYGVGQYRQQVYDSNSNLIWDQLTASNAGFLSGVEVVGNYSVSAADAGMLILPSGGATVTLPSASSVNGIALTIASNQNAGATVTLSGGTLIGGGLSGSTSVTLGYGSWLSVVADGALNEWIIVSSSGDITSVHGFFATNSGTSSWTAPAGVRSILYIITGGGGGGANSLSTSSSGDFSGGGGGAGATALGQMSLTPLQSLAYSVGAGGSSQSNGGTTSLNGVSVSGGSGTNFQAGTVSSGGAPGSTFGGSPGMQVVGGYGCDGQSGTYVAAGMGGASFWGGGGKSVFGGNGIAGQAWGSGGGGAQDGAFSGGAGAAGVVVIIW